MKRSFVLAVSAALLLTTGVAGAAVAQMHMEPSAYAAALADPVRTDADKARDEGRHTAETLAFAEVMPGQTIGDMIIGGGYFTRVFAAATGPTGKVIAWQPAQFIGFQASYADAIAAADALPNVEGIRSPLGAPEFPTGMDLVFTA